MSVSQLMTTRAKYGWAVGLIAAGLVLALPFRKSSDAPAVAQQTTQASASANAEDPKTELSAAESTPRAIDSKALLPNSVGEDILSNEVESQLSDQGKRPRRLSIDREESVQPTTRDNHSNAEESDRIVQNDRPASLKPVEFSNRASNEPQRSMPPSVGPYRMKPVPQSRFLRASQSADRSVVQNVHHSRNVIHYRLRDGDSLRSIAQRYLGDESRFDEILADNRHVLTNGENFLPIGKYITIIVQ